MEQIALNLKNPEWWFTGLFFLVIGIILTKAISSWIPFVWEKLSIYAPRFSNKIQRRIDRKILIMVKNKRQEDMKIIWLIGRFWSIFIILVIYSGFVLSYFALIPEFSTNKLASNELVLLSIPTYLLLIIFLYQKKYLMKLMDENHKWKKRITRS